MSHVNPTSRTVYREATILVALVTALTACTADHGDPDKPRTAATVTAAPTSASPSPSPTGPQTYSLTDKARWGDVTISLKDFRRGRTDDVGVPEDTDYVRFTVIAANGTTTPLDLGSVLISCITQEVYDGMHKLEGVPTVHVLPGKSLTWDIACAQKKRDDYLQVEINPQLADDDRIAIFAGTVK